MGDSSLVQRISFIALAATAFALTATVGFRPDLLTAKTGLLSFFSIVGICITLIPFDWAITVFFCYVGIEGFAKLMSSYNPVVHVGTDILVVILVTRAVLQNLFLREGLPRKFPPLTPLFALHFGWFILAIANPYALGLVASLAAAKLYVTMPLLFFFGYAHATSVSRVRRFMVPWIAVAVIQSAASIYQASVGPASVTGLHPLYGQLLERYAAFRPFGLTSLPGMPAVYVFITLPFAIYFLISSSSLIIKGLSMALLPGGAVTLFICQIRSALLKGIIGSSVFLFLAIKWMKFANPLVRRNTMIAAASIVAIVALVTPQALKLMVESYKDNEEAVERSLTIFDFDKASKARGGAIKRLMYYATLSPLGSGLSRTGAAGKLFNSDRAHDPFSKVVYFTDNLWVALVVDLGIPGAMIMAMLVLAILIRGAIALRNYDNSELKLLHAAIYCNTFVITLGSFAAEPILYNPEASMFWFFSGVMMRLPSLERSFVAESSL